MKKSELKELTDQWESEKRAIDAVKTQSLELEKSKIRVGTGYKRRRLRQASRIQYASIPELQDKIQELSKMNLLPNHRIFA